MNVTYIGVDLELANWVIIIAKLSDKYFVLWLCFVLQHDYTSVSLLH
jgi:hypothetical protein